LLIIFSALFSYAPLATFFAQCLGLLISMFATMDLWWARISHEVYHPISIAKRIEFLAIGSVSAVISTVFSYIILGTSQYKTTELLIVNWLALATIAVLKYLVLNLRIIKN
jgi:hypothetical protein